MKASDIPDDVRAEMDGKGAEPQTFTAWMNAQTPDEQAALFGEKNAKRWQSGAITQVALLKQPGNALSVAKFIA
jgi:hypothetical protein